MTQFQQSLVHHRLLLEVYDKKLDKKNSLFAGFYNNFALALSEVKNYEKAKEYFKMAIGVLESSNPLNPDIAVSLINLAHTDWEQNKNKENVTEYLFRANQILGDEKAEKNSHLALVLSKCAPSFEFFGFKKLAEDYKKISEEIYERS